MVTSRKLQTGDSPPLMNGDRLSRAEFEQRYADSPHIHKAELIDGVVYVASPTLLPHARSHAILVNVLQTYDAYTPNVQALDNASVRLDQTAEPQPDLLLRIVEGGQSVVDADQYVSGAPELIVEVAYSSVSHDLHQKKHAYGRAGVLSYVVYQVHERRVRWFDLAEGDYLERPPDDDGVYRSRVFPGLWLSGPALAEDDSRLLLATLQAGLASPEHEAFAAAQRARIQGSA